MAHGVGTAVHPLCPVVHPDANQFPRLGTDPSRAQSDSICSGAMPQTAAARAGSHSGARSRSASKPRV